jgi:site-specific recombinase XerD
MVGLAIADSRIVDDGVETAEPVDLRKRAGQKAGLPFQAHAHMLGHSAGYKLAGDGHDTRAIQDYLGHRNISNTVRYTELSPTRFKEF